MQMQSYMIRDRHKFQVFQCIVEAVTVNVMDTVTLWDWAIPFCPDYTVDSIGLPARRTIFIPPGLKWNSSTFLGWHAQCPMPLLLVVFMTQTLSVVPSLTVSDFTQTSSHRQYPYP